MSTYTSILTGSLKNRNVFLTVLEAGSGRSGSQHGQGVVRTLFRLQTECLCFPQIHILNPNAGVRRWEVN